MLQPAITGNSQPCLVIAASTLAENRYETISALRFGQDALKVRRVFTAPPQNIDALAQEIMRLEEALERATQVLIDIQQERVHQRCRAGEIGRGSFEAASIDHFELIQRYTSRLNELRDMQRPASV